MSILFVFKIYTDIDRCDYMNKKNIFILIAVIGIISLSGLTFLFTHNLKNDKEKTRKMTAAVISMDDKTLTVQDSNQIIYTFLGENIKAEMGESIRIEYSGKLNKNKNIQDSTIIRYTTSTVSLDDNGIPTTWLDNGIFSNYYILANNKLKSLSLDEKIAQLLLVRYPDAGAKEELKKYQFGGYVFFEKDFKNKTEKEVQDMMSSLQEVAKIPILTAVDEEGGKVVRVSSNTNLVNEKFKSSKELYADGGFAKISEDTIYKSKILKNLGINLNLAPVIDVSTNSSDYMYDRALGENTDLTSTYAKTVISASKDTGVSYTLKHFPGYGNNADTHTSGATDTRSYDDILNNDIPPFTAGINAGAEAILVSHNTVNSIDANNPASLSTDVHNLLRNKLGFTGIIMTDDLAMGAVSTINNATVKAILAGNDMIITTDYNNSMNEIKNAVSNNTIDENLIDRLAFRVLAWKYYKGLMFENHK